jgi:hypothetical protein
MKRNIAVIDQLTWNRHELAGVTGRSLEIVDKWISEGIPCSREGKTYIFERGSSIEWIRKRAMNRTGLVTKKNICDDVFPGIELA